MKKVVTETKTVVKEEEVVVSLTIICNKCGREFAQDTSDVWSEHFWDSEVHSFDVGFGYGSKYDMETWGFHLCDDCLTEIVKTFKHVPDGFMMDGDHYLSPERHQMVFEHWKETGEWDDFYGASYEEIVEYHGYYHTNYLNEVIKKYHPDKPLLEETELERLLSDPDRV